MYALNKAYFYVVEMSDYLVEYPNEISGFNENYRLIKI